MFSFRKKQPSIDVEFYERGAINPFARSSVLIDQLPDTFEIETTLHIQGEDWQVSSARPMTKTEFRQTGWLQIYLYKAAIEYAPIDQLLYSLPTISDELPALVHAPLLENVFVVHEDDWRQQELISIEHDDNVNREIASILKIYEDYSADPGFKKLHVREAIRLPLLGVVMTLPELKAKLGVAHVYRGVAFNNVAAIIDNGFAFRTTQGYIAWGQCGENDKLAVLCVHLLDSDSVHRSDLASLDAVQTEFNLLFVDWVRARVTKNISEIFGYS